MIKIYRTYESKCIHSNKYYLLPNIYISIVNMSDSKLEINENTMEHYRRLMKLSCNKDEIEWVPYNQNK